MSKARKIKFLMLCMFALTVIVGSLFISVNALGGIELSIYGKVTNEDGDDLYYAKVEFLRDGSVVKTRGTDTTGHYSFDYSSDGLHIYTFRVSKYEYETINTVGPVRSGTYNYSFEMEYDTLDVSIEGYVHFINEMEQPETLYKATYELWRNKEECIASGKTQSDGGYSISEFTYYKIKNYELRFYYPGYTIITKPVEPEENGMLIINATLDTPMRRYVILLGIDDFNSNRTFDEGIDLADTHLCILKWYEHLRRTFGIPDDNFTILTDRDPENSNFYDDKYFITGRYDYFSSVDYDKYLTNSSTLAATRQNTIGTLQNILWNKAGENDEVIMCFITHGKDTVDDFIFTLLEPLGGGACEELNGSEISDIIADNQCKTGKIFVYTHACHGGKLGEILMNNPKKERIYVTTGCAAEGVVWFPWQDTLLDEIWMTRSQHPYMNRPTVAMEAVFKEAINYMYEHPSDYQISYSYLYHINNPSERIYSYVADGTSYYGWGEKKFISNIPDEYNYQNGYRFNCSTRALNVASGEYYFCLWDVNHSIYVYFFDDYARFEYLAEEIYGYIIENNLFIISITAIDIHGWEHLMPCEYDGKLFNYFYHG